jgi:hypothetical protein
VKTKFLSPEERPERDALMREAGIDPHTGKAYPTWEIKENMRRLLEDASQAGRYWAQCMIADALLIGFGRQWSAWRKEQNRVSANVNGKKVRAAGSQGIRQRSDDGGVTYQQMTFEEMLWPELYQFRDSEIIRRGSADINISIADKLIEMHALAPDSASPAEAAAAIGTTVGEWLLKETPSVI